VLLLDETAVPQSTANHWQVAVSFIDTPICRKVYVDETGVRQSAANS